MKCKPFLSICISISISLGNVLASGTESWWVNYWHSTGTLSPRAVTPISLRCTPQPPVAVIVSILSKSVTDKVLTLLHGKVQNKIVFNYLVNFIWSSKIPADLHFHADKSHIYMIWDLFSLNEFGFYMGSLRGAGDLDYFMLEIL